MIIDLSVLVNLDTPVYPGDPATKIEPAGVMSRDGYEDYYISMGTHLGTHIDAPSHMVAGGKVLAQIPIETFVGRGIYIKLIDKAFDISTVKDAEIMPGDIVLFHTGYGDVYHTPEYFTEHSALPLDIAQYLIDAGVKIVGFDMCSPDTTSTDIHKLLLGNDVLIIENLTNLSALEGKEFDVYALPINLELEAAPARVIAITK